MLGLFNFSRSHNLIKKFHNTSLCDTWRLSCSFFVESILHPFIALHGKCLSTTSLAICKYSGMVALDHLAYQTWDAKACIDVVLSVLLRENLVELVHFTSCKSRGHIHVLLSVVCSTVDNFYFLISICLYFWAPMPRILLLMQQWPYPHRHFYLRSTEWLLGYYLGRAQRWFPSLHAGLVPRLLDGFVSN